jgi:hypothetical protein
MPFSTEEQAVRVYLQCLSAGEKPAMRPDCGRFEQAVCAVERVSVGANGHSGELATRMLRTLVASKKYPGLAELVAERPPALPAIQPDQHTAGGMPALPASVQLPPALAVGACPELDQYEAFSRQASPEAWDDFHVFCGLWAFSTLNAHRSRTRTGTTYAYGNLMLALCADSSMFAKSTTAGVAKQLLQEIGLGHLLGPNRLTPARLLSELSGQFVPTNYTELDDARQDRVKEKLAMPGQKGLYFDEFGKFLQGTLRKNSIMTEFIELFLELDGCPSSYENATIARGSEPVLQPYLALLGSMTPDNLKDQAKAGSDSWRDGFFGRFSFVVAPEATPETVKDCPLSAQALDFPPALLNSLKAWHHRLGTPECVLEEIQDTKTKKPTGRHRIHREPLPETDVELLHDAEDAFKAYRSALKQLSLSFGQKDFYASYARLPETALRMAILMASLSNGNVINLRIWAKAQELAEILRRNLHDLYAQVNAVPEKPTFARSVEERIQAYIEKNQTSTEPDRIPTIRNLSRYIKHVDLKSLRSAVIDMKQAGILEERKVGKAVYYVLLEK